MLMVWREFRMCATIAEPPKATAPMRRKEKDRSDRVAAGSVSANFLAVYLERSYRLNVHSIPD